MLVVLIVIAFLAFVTVACIKYKAPKKDTNQ